jgi:hypothetical protein
MTVQSQSINLFVPLGRAVARSKFASASALAEIFPGIEWISWISKEYIQHSAIPAADESRKTGVLPLSCVLYPKVAVSELRWQCRTALINHTQLMR